MQLPGSRGGAGRARAMAGCNGAVALFGVGAAVAFVSGGDCTAAGRRKGGGGAGRDDGVAKGGGREGGGGVAEV